MARDEKVDYRRLFARNQSRKPTSGVPGNPAQLISIFNKINRQRGSPVSTQNFNKLSQLVVNNRAGLEQVARDVERCFPNGQFNPECADEKRMENIVRMAGEFKNAANTRVFENAEDEKTYNERKTYNDSRPKASKNHPCHQLDGQLDECGQISGCAPVRKGTSKGQCRPVNTMKGVGRSGRSPCTRLNRQQCADSDECQPTQGTKRTCQRKRDPVKSGMTAEDIMQQIRDLPNRPRRPASGSASGSAGGRASGGVAGGGGTVVVRGENKGESTYDDEDSDYDDNNYDGEDHMSAFAQYMSNQHKSGGNKRGYGSPSNTRNRGSPSNMRNNTHYEPGYDSANLRGYGSPSNRKSMR